MISYMNRYYSHDQSITGQLTIVKKYLANFSLVCCGLLKLNTDDQEGYYERK